MDFVSKVFQAVKKDVDTVVAAFNLIVDAVKTVAAGINAGTKAVKTATENLWATIKGVFINVTKFFTDIGKAIIDGIVAGIKAAPKAVADALGGVVNGAVQGVKDLLGIKSPSRVFAEIGSFIVQGLTVGLEGEAPAFLTAVNNLANAAITAIARIRDGNVLSGIQGLVSGIASIFQAGTSPVLKAVGGFLGAISAAIQGWIVAGPLGALLGFIGAAVSWVVSLFGGKPTAAPAAPEIPPAPEVTIPEIEPPKWEPPQQSGMSMPGISIQSAVATPIVEGARIIRDAGASFQGSVNAFGTTVARADAMYLRVEAMFARLEQAAANGTAGLRYA
jgi:phage-related protein